MHVAITGSHGLVGSALLAALAAGGHRVSRLVRPKSEGAGDPADIPWDPASGVVDPRRLEGVDAVVHLAGESIASGRWSSARKAEIRRSRVLGTRRLCESLASLARPPRVLVSASAVGFYGDRGDERLDEVSPPGSGFLAEVCREWEAATEPAASAGVRVVQTRSGIVLSREGGALQPMLLAFKMGVGGKIGSGKQFMSWITIDDEVGAIEHILRTDSLIGPANAVAPTPVTNAEFTRTLAGALSRPALMPMPAFAARLAFGEMADALLLASQRVLPTRLLGSGYPFRYPELTGALQHVLGS
jgi:uncharacterized protein (TIGR01777 family)